MCSDRRSDSESVIDIFRSALAIWNYNQNWYVLRGHVMVKLTFTHRWSDGEITDPAALCASIYHHVHNLTLTIALTLALNPNLTLTLSYLMNRPKHWHAQRDVSDYWMSRPGLAGFCWKVEPFFSAVKTGLAKIVFAGKNLFLPELSSK